jgi:hypothetical protein
VALELHDPFVWDRRVGGSFRAQTLESTDCAGRVVHSQITAFWPGRTTVVFVLMVPVTEHLSDSGQNISQIVQVQTPRLLL